jgi:hypothetical protein
MVKTPSETLRFYDKEVFEVYKNPNLSEIDELFKISMDDGIRMGIDHEGSVYCWPDSILHTDAERLLQKDFVLKLEYTKNRNKLVLSTADMTSTKEELLKLLDRPKLAKLKLIFPEINTIEMNRKPFTVLYNFDEKQSFKNLKHSNIEDWIQKLSLLELREYSKKHPNLSKETKKMLDKERILRNLERQQI